MLPTSLLRSLPACAALMLCACSGVSVHALHVDGTIDDAQAEGLRYYMPHPYLLVAELPTPLTKKVTKTTTETTTTSQDALQREAAPPPADAKSAGPATGSKSDGGDTTETKQDQTGAGGSNTDLSFSAIVGNYQLKLIYLPDYSKPMSIQLKTGLFGTASYNPTLQDGWMLTSLNGSATSDGANALQAFATVVTAVKSTVASHGTGNATPMTAAPGKTTTVREEKTDTTTTELHWGAALRPGLYEFSYDVRGTLIGLCRVSSFPSRLVTGQCYAWKSPLISSRG